MPPRYVAVPFLGPGPFLPIPDPTVTANVVSSTEIDVTINYSGPPGASLFAFETASSAVGPFVPLNSGSSSTFKHTGLTQNTTFFYRGRVQVPDGRFSNPSAVVSAITLAGVPSAPSGLVASDIDNTDIGLTWSSALNASSYNVHRLDLEPTPLATGLTSLSFTDSGLSPGTTYTYFVTGVNPAGEGPGSNQSSATTSGTINPGLGTPVINWSPGHWFEIGGLDFLHSITDFTTNSQIMVNTDTTNIIEGFSAVFDFGQVGQAPFTSWFSSVQQMLTFCQNNNKKLFINLNMTGNVVHATVPSDMLNNPTYGKVGSGPGTATNGYQGGLFNGTSPINYDPTTNTSPNGSAKIVRIDVPATAARIAAACTALYNQFGNQIYGINPCYSEIESLNSIVPELTSSAIVASLYGQGGMFDQVRAGCPTWFLLTTPSFLAQSDYPTIFACTDRNNVSVAVYDFCNDTAVRTGGAFRTFPTIGAFLGGQYVNNVFQPNFPGLIDRRAQFGGRDFSAHIGPDELGARSSSGSTTGTVPPARIGDGALNKALWPMVQTMQVSHIWWYKNVGQGPPCNTLASYTGQPANYPDYTGWGNLFGFIKTVPITPTQAYPSTWPTH